MEHSVIEPQFIYPVNEPRISYNPNIAKFIMSRQSAQKNSVIMLGSIQRTIKFSEELTVSLYPATGNLFIARGFLNITTKSAIDKLIQELGFLNRDSFIRSVFQKYTIVEKSAKVKVFIHHFFDETVMPPI